MPTLSLGGGKGVSWCEACSILDLHQKEIMDEDRALSSRKPFRQFVIGINPAVVMAAGRPPCSHEHAAIISETVAWLMSGTLLVP